MQLANRFYKTLAKLGLEHLTIKEVAEIEFLQVPTPQKSEQPTSIICIAYRIELLLDGYFYINSIQNQTFAPHLSSSLMTLEIINFHNFLVP